MAKSRTRKTARRKSVAPRTIRYYGWIPDLPDARDLRFAVPRLAAIPAHVDLRPQCPPVYDQGQLGSCTANAIAGALEFDQRKQALPEFTPSRLFIYYNERVIEHTVDQDSGAMIRDGIKSVNTSGAPHETLWPYLIARFADKPSAGAVTDAKRHRSVVYERLTPTTDELRACLAAGFPFVFGFSVYASFESASVAKTGRVPMPAPGEQQLGGHAVMAVGYDQGANEFIVRNSWGPKWGQAGYFTMPTAYLTDGNLSDDFWTIHTTL